MPMEDYLNYNIVHILLSSRPSHNLKFDVIDLSWIYALMAFLFSAGPSDAPLAATPFEAFVKVPKFLRPHTQIYCTRC